MNDPVNGITASEFAARLSRGDTLAVLDVREPRERAHCLIPVPESLVDLHVPIGSVPTHVVEIRRACAGRSLVVYCHHGVRSMMVGEWLAAQGVGPVFNLDGGIDAWSAAVDPTVPRY